MNHLWMTKPDDVTRMLARIEDYAHPRPPTLSDIESITGNLRDNIVRGTIQPNDVNWADYFMRVGSDVRYMLIVDGKDGFDRDVFVQMLLDKHRRYGVKSLAAWRELGVLTRVDQKIARWSNMSSQRITDQGDESLYDTMVDIIGYCVIGLHMLERLPKL